MQIRVRFFSQLRDLASADDLNLDLPPGTTVATLLESLYCKWDGLRSADRTILVAVGVDFVDRNFEIREGDEISIMPPVQGG